MDKKFVLVSNCVCESILAEDVISNDGIKLIAKDTSINSYIIKRLAEIGVDKVWVYEVSRDDGNDYGKQKMNELKKEYARNVILIKNILKDISTGKILRYEAISEVTSSLYNMMNDNNYVLRCLDEIKTIDEYTYTHSLNTAFYAMLIAWWMKLPGQEIKEIIQAGLVHDIGKTRVPGDILNKPGRLTEEEYDVIKRHTIYGYSMLDNCDAEIGKRVKDAVLFHHERINGSGYPMGASNDKIDLYAKIIGIADVYDAITSDRVYKRKATPFDAFDVFTLQGFSIFDISILKIFLNNLPAYYTGIKVLLSSGQTGEVVYIPPHDISCPVIRCGPVFIDMSKKTDTKIIGILNE